MPTVIRRAEVTDVPNLQKLMIEYIVDFYGKKMPTQEKLGALIQLLLEQKEGVQFVAVVDDELVGFATLYFSYSTLRVSKIVTLNDLYVIEAQRGKGAAAELFTACKVYAAGNGYASMNWSTAKDNVRAQLFYDKMGAEQEGWLSYSIKPTSISFGD